jgi:hypothetical protein
MQGVNEDAVEAREAATRGRVKFPRQTAASSSNLWKPILDSCPARRVPRAYLRPILTFTRDPRGLAVRYLCGLTLSSMNFRGG